MYIILFLYCQFSRAWVFFLLYIVSFWFTLFYHIVDEFILISEIENFFCQVQWVCVDPRKCAIKLSIIIIIIIIIILWPTPALKSEAFNWWYLISSHQCGLNFCVRGTLTLVRFKARVSWNQHVNNTMQWCQIPAQ